MKELEHLKEHFTSTAVPISRVLRARSWIRLCSLLGLIWLCYAILRKGEDLTHFALSLYGALSALSISHLRPSQAIGQQLCHQEEILLPARHLRLWQNLSSQVYTLEARQSIVEWLSGAVKIPTVSFDAMGEVGEDERWKAFAPLHEYLLVVFPLIHSKLTLTKVNTYGLIYEWDGSDRSLKPILLTAHQDVVPVDPTTVDEWTHPPFSGHYDGAYVWGRGSSDDKGGLMAIMSSVEILLRAGFEPQRKVVLSFGFDEEATGMNGAHKLSQYLQKTYGNDSLALLIDEGDGLSERYGTIFAIPAIGEKGYLDTHVQVTSPGGHSSIPPPHTSIGLLASMLVAMESNPMALSLDRHSPIYEEIVCMAEFGTKMDEELRSLILKSATSDEALMKLEKLVLADPLLSSTISTTQAIDLIKGGIKANALPEQAWALVNHRIATQSSVAEAMEHDTSVLSGLSKRFSLTFESFGRVLFNGTKGKLTLSDAWFSALEPAPITSTAQSPFKLLSGTIKATYGTRKELIQADQIVVSPGIMTGNTDTQFYWNLTSHIFRYNHEGLHSSGLHTVDERILVDELVEMIRFVPSIGHKDLRRRLIKQSSCYRM